MKKIIKLVLIIAAVAVFSSVFVFDPFKLNLSFFKHELSIDKTANVVTQIKKIAEFTTACYYEEFVLKKEKYTYHEIKKYDKDASNSNLKNIEKSAGSAWKAMKGAAGKALNMAKEDNDTTTKGKILSAANTAKEIAVAAGSAGANLVASAAPEVLELAKKDNSYIDSTKVGDIVFIVKTRVRAGYDFSKIGENDLTVRGDTLSIKLPEVEIFDIIANPSDWEIYDRTCDWDDSEIRAIQTSAKEGIKQDAIDYGIMEKAASFGKESLSSLFKTFGFSEVVFL